MSQPPALQLIIPPSQLSVAMQSIVQWLACAQSMPLEQELAALHSNVQSRPGGHVSGLFVVTSTTHWPLLHVPPMPAHAATSQAPPPSPLLGSIGSNPTRPHATTTTSNQTRTLDQ